MPSFNQEPKVLTHVIKTAVHREKHFKIFSVNIKVKLINISDNLLLKIRRMGNDSCVYPQHLCNGTLLVHKAIVENIMAI